MASTEKTALVGDIRLKGNCENLEQFLSELEHLMARYKIDKVDVAWSKFTSSESQRINPGLTGAVGTNLGINN